MSRRRSTMFSSRYSPACARNAFSVSARHHRSGCILIVHPTEGERVPLLSHSRLPTDLPKRSQRNPPSLSVVSYPYLRGMSQRTPRGRLPILRDGGHEVVRGVDEGPRREEVPGMQGADREECRMQPHDVYEVQNAHLLGVHGDVPQRRRGLRPYACDPWRDWFVELRRSEVSLPDGGLVCIYPSCALYLFCCLSHNLCFIAYFDYSRLGTWNSLPFSIVIPKFDSLLYRSVIFSTCAMSPLR